MVSTRNSFIADFDGTLSTELAMINNKEDFPGGGHARHAELRRWHANPVSGRGRRRLHPERREGRRSRQGPHEILDATEGHGRQPEGRSGPLGAGHTAGR